jgi:hypothetical protein
MTAAFLLKGPARFEPMRLRHLGKNSDQIVRLSDEPGEVLIVQHCHDITPVVRKTIRAFAVQPSLPRRYCCIDGRDTLRLLHAYDLYEDALAFHLKNVNRVTPDALSVCWPFVAVSVWPTRLRVAGKKKGRWTMPHRGHVRTVDLSALARSRVGGSASRQYAGRFHRSSKAVSSQPQFSNVTLHR